MSETAVGLFECPDLEDQFVHDLNVRAYPREPHYRRGAGYVGRRSAE